MFSATRAGSNAVGCTSNGNFIAHSHIVPSSNCSPDFDKHGNAGNRTVKDFNADGALYRYCYNSTNLDASADRHANANTLAADSYDSAPNIDGYSDTD